MNHQQYSIQDLKNGEFDSPFRALNDEDAIRGVILGIRSGKPMFAQFPADYSLYHVGYFKSEDGSLVSNGSPRHIANIQSLAVAYGKKEDSNAQKA